MVERRFVKNIGTFTESEYMRLQQAKIFIAGCGGSQYIIDALARAGVMNIAVADGDVFEISNLNRQLFSNISNIGRKKVEVACEYVKLINPDINFIAYPEYVTNTNVNKLISGYDIVLDCVDNIETRLELQYACNGFQIPLIFGGMGKWLGQVGVSWRGAEVVRKIYTPRKKQKKSNEKLESTTAFVNAFTSAIYVSLCIKVILNPEEVKINQLYMFDLYNMKTVRYDPSRILPIFKKW